MLNAKIGEIKCCHGATPLIMTALDMPSLTSRECRSSLDPPHIPSIKCLQRQSSRAQLHAVLAVDEEELLFRPVVAHHFLSLSVAQHPQQTNTLRRCGAFTSKPSPSGNSTTGMKKSLNLDVRRDVLSQSRPGALVVRSTELLKKHSNSL